MKKVFILLLVVVYVLYSSEEKLKKIKKNPRPLGDSFDRVAGHKYPADIIESVRSDIPGDPQIKIRFGDAENEDDEAMISVESEDEDEDEEDDIPTKKEKLPKSKAEDIHSFL